MTWKLETDTTPKGIFLYYGAVKWIYRSTTTNQYRSFWVL